MNVTLIGASLGCGGAERVFTLLARGFDERGHRVVAITTTAKEDFYTLPSGITRIAFDLVGRRRAHEATLSWPTMAFRALANLPVLRSAILRTRPDVVVTFGDQINIVVLLCMLGSGCPVVISEHNDSSRHRLALPWRILRRLAYARSERLVSVSVGVDRGFRWLPAQKRTVIYNPVEVPGTSDPNTTLPAGLHPGRFVVAVGRLTSQKGFDLLLEAASNVLPDAPGWSLAILGQGEDHASLTARASALGLGKRVVFLGAIADPFTVLRQAAFFVLSSRWEGFPMVLLEALACELPVVSFDCPSGPSEVVKHGANGLLVPAEDVDQLAVAMRRMIDEETTRERMRGRAVQSVHRFSLDTIMTEWERQILLPLRGRSATDG